MSREFTLWSAAQNRYFFSQNPASVNNPELEFTEHKTLEGQYVRQSLWNESYIYEWHWDNAPATLYSNLKNFANRNANGVIPTAIFYDGDVGFFPVVDSSPPQGAVASGTPVKILDIIGEPLRDFMDDNTTHRFKIVMKVQRAG